MLPPALDGRVPSGTFGAAGPRSYLVTVFSNWADRMY
jgi:hypothetical protein